MTNLSFCRVHRKNRICSTYVAYTSSRLQRVRRQVQGRLSFQESVLLRSVSRDVSCAISTKNSLRDIEASLIAVEHKLYHSGISYAVTRNTLAKANEQRDCRLYSNLDWGMLVPHSCTCQEEVGLEQYFNKNQNSVSTDEYPNLFSMS